MYTGDDNSTSPRVAFPTAIPLSEQGRSLSIPALLSDDERKQLAYWNTTQEDYPFHNSLPQLVEMQVEAHPNAVAIVAGDESLTYNELNERSNRLAHHLQALGVGPDVPVGICIERSIELVVGLLGILKAGGAYVPLDPGYPSERLAFMLHDAQVSVLVTMQHLAQHLPTMDGYVVLLDSDQPVLARQIATDPVVVSTPDNLVYIIYTSGSTGQPKGVEITHKSLLNLVFWHQKAFSVVAADRATQVTSPAFDATGWELWPYLTAGASVYMPDEETRVSSLDLRDWLLRHGITISFLPTALAESMLQLHWPATTALRFLLTGADTLHYYPPADLPFTFVNNYGPTEATVVTTSGSISASTDTTELPPIGRPIANMQVYILNDHLQQVPIGSPGELYIGGVGLARGYRNRPDLTAERFVSHPFGSEPTARLYKTGDTALFLPNGQISFIGRIDHQIKIRGFRIEPNEIVQALNEYPGIQNSYVLAREDTPGDKRLVAYVILAPEEQVTASALRDKLMTRLPDYMLPTAFVKVNTLPLTFNGKVDRDALPSPDTTNSIRDDELISPSTPSEERIAKIVCSLLHIKEIGIDDNFFMLGGHSLLGTQIIARIADAFEVGISLRTLFEAATVRELAVEVERLVFEKIKAMSDDDVQSLLQ